MIRRSSVHIISNTILIAGPIREEDKTSIYFICSTKFIINLVSALSIINLRPTTLCAPYMSENIKGIRQNKIYIVLLFNATNSCRNRITRKIFNSIGNRNPFCINSNLTCRARSYLRCPIFKRSTFGIIVIIPTIKIESNFSRRNQSYIRRFNVVFHWISAVISIINQIVVNLIINRFPFSIQNPILNYFCFIKIK